MEHNSHMIIGILLHILGSGGCTYRNREYEPGATVNIAVAPKYDRCDECKCIRGKLKKCIKLYSCHVVNQCKMEDYVWRPDSCCPECQQKGELCIFFLFLSTYVSNALNINWPVNSLSFVLAISFCILFFSTYSCYRRPLIYPFIFDPHITCVSFILSSNSGAPWWGLNSKFVVSPAVTAIETLKRKENVQVYYIKA